MVTFRGFISVDMEDTRALAPLHRELKAIGGGLKMVDLNVVHVTLKFLGDVDERFIPQLVEAMESAAKGVSQFDIDLKGVGAFPTTSNIRVVWVGMGKAERLVHMAKILEERTAALGFQNEERPFTPHLTLGRMNEQRSTSEVKRVIEQYTSKDFGSFPVRSIRLKKSVLGPKGPTYTNVAEVVLQAP